MTVLTQSAWFATSDEVQSALSRLFPRGRAPEVVVGVAHGSQIACAATVPHAPPSDIAVPLGCTIKLLTAAMLVAAILERRISLTESVTTILDPDGSRGAQFLDGISLRDLLEHTHGLDGSALMHHPVQLDGFTDLRLLCEAIAHTRIAPPGRLYNYGDIGGWLSAVILERLARRSYTHLLAEFLERHSVELRPEHLITAPVCPSGGAGIALRMADLVTLVDRLALDAGLEQSTRIVPLSGWSAAERGIYLGWKCYAGGWFGHNSVVPTAPVCIRTHPVRRMTIIVATNGYSPTVIASRLFRNVLLEAASARLPRLLGAQEISADALRRYVGCYESQRSRIVVAARSDGSLQITAVHRRASPAGPAAFCEAGLKPAEDAVFLLDPPSDSFPFVQFIGSDAGMSRPCLWNGRSLWPRVSIS